MGMLLISNSCSLMNNTNVTVPINSNPPGADVYIDGKFFGQTPVFANLDPSNDYSATVSKPGYGSTNVSLETWYSVRDGRGAESTRCILDAFGTMLVVPAFGFFSVHCRDFKQTDYFVNLSSNAGNPSIDGQINSTNPYNIQSGNQMNYGGHN